MKVSDHMALPLEVVEDPIYEAIDQEKRDEFLRRWPDNPPIWAVRDQDGVYYGTSTSKARAELEAHVYNQHDDLVEVLREVADCLAPLDDSVLGVASSDEGTNYYIKPVLSSTLDAILRKEK